MRTFAILLPLALAALFAAPASSAFGAEPPVTPAGSSIVDVTGRLLSVDLTTGATAPSLQPFPVGAVAGADLDESTGTVYAESFGGQLMSQSVSADSTTAPATVGLSPSDPADHIARCTGLDIPAAGTILTSCLSDSAGGYSVGSVDPETGKYTVVAAGVPWLTDLATNPVDGKVYAFSQYDNGVYSVDLASRTSTQVSTYAGSQIDGVDFNSDGTLWATTADRQIVTIDTSDWSVHPVTTFSIPDAYSESFFVQPTPVVAPTPVPTAEPSASALAAAGNDMTGPDAAKPELASTGLTFSVGLIGAALLLVAIPAVRLTHRRARH